MADKKELNLSPPWISFFRGIESLFGKDPDIRIVHTEGSSIIDLYVDNPVKANALAQLIPPIKTFGNAEFGVNVIPPNPSKVTDASLFRSAFDGNPALSFVEEINTPMTGDIAYVVFKNEVVQYPNDDLSDLHGLKSTLYQDIAKDLFTDVSGIFFCTDMPD